MEGSEKLGKIASVGSTEEGLNPGTPLAVPLAFSLEPHTLSLLELLQTAPSF